MKTVKSILIGVSLNIPYILALILGDLEFAITLVIGNTLIMLLFLIKDEDMRKKWVKYSVVEKIAQPVIMILWLIQIFIWIMIEDTYKKIRGRKNE